MIAIGLAALALLLFVWSYLVYPFLVERLAAAAPSHPVPPRSPGSVEVLVSAADEEESIGERVRNLLEDQEVAGLRVRVGCDGCVDATAERAREASRRSLGQGGLERVSVVEFPSRRGKAAVLNDLLGESDADTIVFTDANTRFELGAADRLIEPFGDAGIGAVCGRLLFESGAAEATPEARFWDRETESKSAEGRLGVCLGANGAIYAARRALIEPLAPDTAMDDFLIPARIAAAGHRVVFEGSAVAREPAAPDVFEEVSRRFRLGIGAGQVLRRERWLWNFRRHRFLSFAFASRKAARWLAPVAALAAAAAALFDSRLRVAGGVLLALAGLLILIARLRPRLRGPAGRLYYFGVINVALAAGVLAGLAGYRRPAWRRTARS